MRCSDLRKKTFVLDRELLAKEDYLNLLARPKWVRNWNFSLKTVSKLNFNS